MFYLYSHGQGLFYINFIEKAITIENVKKSLFTLHVHSVEKREVPSHQKKIRETNSFTVWKNTL